jgi:large subunit ribosomal protein L9
MMELILKEDVIGLGEEGDVVKVKDGYGRNYLLPKGYAVRSNANNMRILEKQKETIEQRKQEKKERNLGLKEKIENTKIELERRVVEGSKLYGSVSGKDLVEILHEKGIEITKQNIEMPGPLKIIGDYSIPIKLSTGDKADLKVSIRAIE